jgi:hypothetical protein
MNKKNVIIAGYPKSGTTWLSRLVAELIVCPLIGDWGFENMRPPFSEGMDRGSEYQCFKSHHTYEEISQASDLPIHKIIYIVRDPRDVVISGAHYFQFTPSIVNFLIFGPFRRILYRLTSKKEKKKQMIKAVLKGNASINQWLTSSWKSHYEGYLKDDVLVVRYEDLLKTPFKECNRISTFLSIPVKKDHIAECIHIQSFQNKKNEKMSMNQGHFKELLRKGSSGYWKEDFSDQDIEQFKNVFKDLELPYEF